MINENKAIKCQLTISDIEKHGDVYRVVCESADVLPKIEAGQFAHIKVPNRELRRPICVYDNTDRTITFIIATVGEGTTAFINQGVGAKFDAILPLGNGFPILPDVTNIVIMGGGTGAAALLKIAKDNPWLNCTALLGFPNKEMKEAFHDDFDKACKRVCYCTDDGSLGYKGYPTELLTEVAPDVLYVCGAPAMMRTAQKFCRDRGAVGFATVEQRMGCGVGACLVCSVKVNRNGEEKLLRACADGPVFDIKELVL